MPIMNGTGIKPPVMEKASYVPIGIIASIIWHLNTMESYRNALMQCHLMETDNELFPGSNACNDTIMHSRHHFTGNLKTNAIK